MCYVVLINLSAENYRGNSDLRVFCFIFRSYEVGKEEGEGTRNRTKEPECGWCVTVDLFRQGSSHHTNAR